MSTFFLIIGSSLFGFAIACLLYAAGILRAFAEGMEEGKKIRDEELCDEAQISDLRDKEDVSRMIREDMGFGGEWK